MRAQDSIAVQVPGTLNYPENEEVSLPEGLFVTQLLLLGSKLMILCIEIERIINSGRVLRINLVLGHLSQFQLEFNCGVTKSYKDVLKSNNN